MKKLLFMKSFLLIFFSFFIMHLTVSNNVNAQGTVVTSPPVNGTTTWGGITFNLQSTQSIIVDTIYVNTSGTVGGTVNLEIWYNPTAINGQPAPFTGAPWINVIASQNLPAGVELAPIFIPGGLTIPAGSNWGFYIGDPAFSNSGIKYGSSSTSSSVTDGVVTIEMGTNVGYGWVRDTPSTSNHPRFFAGGVNYGLATPCVGTPVAGTAVGPTSICANQNLNLSLTGNTQASGLTYQWMSSSSATGPWTPVVGATTLNAVVSQTTDTYYRCEVICTNSTLSDNSSVVFVQTSPNLPAGTYTVGTGGDYASFTAATAAMSCGIAGPVVFNALPGSGPFNEQITIPEIINSSATNTITFNGNGETLTSATTTGSRSLILLNGADYVTIDSFNLVTQSATDNFVIQLINDADHNTISNNIIDMSSTLASTSSSNAGLIVSGSLTSATATTGASGSNNSIIGNNIIGGYYSICVNGQSATPSENNIISDNKVEDFYYYGISLRYGNDNMITDNEISRSNRNSVSSFYGIYLASGGEGHIISENYIHTPFGGITANSTSTNYGIYFTAQDSPLGNESQVFNNIIHLSGNNGSIDAIYNSSSDGVRYYHNTITLDDASSASGIARGFYQISLATNIEFKNNIVNITREGSGTKYCLYFSTATSSIVSDYNVLHINSTGGTNGVGYLGGAQTSLANWQTASGGDANSVDFNPILVSSPTVKQIPTNPLVDNIVLPIASVTTDYSGALRSATAPDPGAHEFSPPTCLTPLPLFVTNITSTSADLNWTENSGATIWNIEYGVAGFVPGTGTIVNGVTSNPHSITLSPNTEYEFYVQSDCGNGDLSYWAGPRFFSNDYCEFTISSTSPQHISSFITTGAIVNINNPNSGAGTTSVGYSDFTTMVMDAYITQTIDFDIVASNTSTYGVSIFVDWNNDFVFDSSEKVYGTTGYISMPMSGSFLIPVGASIGQHRMRVIIDYLGNTPSACGGNSAEAEDYTIEIIAPPSCLPPMNINALTIATNTIELEWDEINSATSWTIEYGPIGFTQGQGTVVTANANPFTVTGLNPSSGYDFYIQSDCSGGDLSSWAGPFSVYTNCGVAVAPFYEGFNNAAQPQCWDNLSSNPGTGVDNFWRFNKQGEHGALANGKPIGTFAVSDGSTPNPDSMILITPEIDISQLTTPYLSFEWFSNNTNFPGDNTPLIVELFDGSSWHFLDTLRGDNPKWLFESYNLSAYSNNIIQIRFMTNQTLMTNSPWFNDILLDEIRVDNCVSGTGGSKNVCRLDGTVNLNDNIIVAAHGGGKWSYPAIESLITNDSIFNFSSLPSGAYQIYYIEKIACLDTTIATINVFKPSSAGEGSSITVCKNAPIDLFSALSGNTDMGGDWYDYNGILLPNSQPLAPNLSAQYNFNYIATNGVCPADTALVEVNVGNCIWAVDEEVFTEISVFPNPATKKLNIVNPSNTSSLKVEMLDINGRVVLVENKALNNATDATIEIDHLERGVYTLRVYNAEGQKTFKVVKQ